VANISKSKASFHKKKKGAPSGRTLDLCTVRKEHPTRKKRTATKQKTPIFDLFGSSKSFYDAFEESEYKDTDGEGPLFTLRFRRIILAMSTQQKPTQGTAYSKGFQSQPQNQTKLTFGNTKNLEEVVKKAVRKFARSRGYLITTTTQDGKVQEKISSQYHAELKDLFDRLFTVLKLNEGQLRKWQDRPNQSFIITEDDMVYALYRVALFIHNFPEVKEAVDKIYIIPNAALSTLIVYPHYLLLADIFMRHANVKYYRFHVDTENGVPKSATVKFYVEGVEGSLDFTVFASDLALFDRMKDKQATNNIPNLTVMLCKQALRQGLSLYFPAVAIKMAISVDNIVAEGEFATNRT
jgi:hypothetical protein